MKSARQFGIVLLLLVSYLTPAMACSISGVTMNAVDRACCRTMQDHCAQVGMQSLVGCCQKTPQSARDNVLDTKAVRLHPFVVAAIWLSAPDGFHPAFVTAGWLTRPGDSPPQSPPGSISILRI